VEVPSSTSPESLPTMSIPAAPITRTGFSLFKGAISIPSATQARIGRKPFYPNQSREANAARRGESELRIRNFPVAKKGIF
jgi:hypothetical protein